MLPRCSVAALSRGDIQRMELDASVTKRDGTRLPSIRDAEQEMGVPPIDDDGEGSSRKALYHARKRLTNLRRHSDLMQHIKCPVCLNACTPQTMVVTCVVAEHHMCLACLVGMLVNAESRLSHRCPTCQRMLFTKRPSVAMLALVGDIMGVDVAAADGACAYARTYHKFTQVRLVNLAAPYSYTHLVVFAQLIKHYGDVDTLNTLLHYVRIYREVSETARLLAETHARP